MKKVVGLIFLLLLAAVAGCVQGSTSSGDVKALNAKLDDMNVKLDAINDKTEKLWSIRPTVAQFMPEYAERFHVMHFAGDAEDWPVASHEYEVMQKIRLDIETVDADKGAMMKAFEDAHLSKVRDAIEEKSMDEFSEAINSAIVGCNSCHTAVGSPFLKVTLEVPEGLTLRHSHILEEEKEEVGHTH